MKEGWEYKKLEDCCNVNYGTRVVRREVEGKKYPVYGGGGETFRIDDYNREDCLVVSRFAMSKQCTRIVKGKFFLNDSGLTVSPKDTRYLLPHYLNRFILASNDLIYSMGRGSAQRNLNMQKFREIIISFPESISEQQRVVSYLDSAFAKIDAVAKNAEASLNEAKALFQSALTKMMEPKEGWGKKKFGDICTFVRGPFGGSLKKNCFKESGYAVYEQQNAIYNKFSFRYFIDEDKYKSMSRFKVEPGDLIMSCSGTIGKVAIIPRDAKEGIINQALLKLTPSTKIDAEFLKYLMESSFFKSLLSLNAGGAAINNITSVSTLKKIELSIPTVEKQREIVKKLNSLKKVFLDLTANLSLTLTECTALKQAILRQTFE